MFPDGLQTVGEDAFSRCKALRAVTFGEGLQTVGKSAFEGCQALQTVTFPEGLQKIGKRAFGYIKYDEKIDGFTIYGAPGSVAEEHARANGFRFEAR